HHPRGERRNEGSEQVSGLAILGGLAFPARAASQWLHEAAFRSPTVTGSRRRWTGFPIGVAPDDRRAPLRADLSERPDDAAASGACQGATRLTSSRTRRMFGACPSKIAKRKPRSMKHIACA